MSYSSLTADRADDVASVDDTSASARERYILIVDDETAVREFLAHALERAGYVVKQAADAAVALEMMYTEPAALVLCDIRLPGEDGVWLTQRMNAHWPRTPVVMITAIDDIDTMRRCRDLGAIDYLTKPIGLPRLAGIVRRAMDRSDTDTASHEHSASIGPSIAVVDDHAGIADEDPSRADAEYTLESPVKCPACGERIERLQAVRLIRGHVNFTSTLPRRGRVLVCPHCLAIVPGELTNF